MEMNGLDKILDYRVLTEMYQDYERAGTTNTLFNFYTGVPSTNYPMDTVEFVKLSRVQDPAPINFRGQPARVLSGTGKEKRRLTMFNMFDVLTVGMDTLEMIRHPEQWALQDRGRIEMQQQSEDMATRHALTKQIVVAKTLTAQNIYADASGEILESSSGAAVTIPTGLPSANLGQIAGGAFGITGDIISGAWDNPATKILNQLDILREAAQAQGTEVPRHVWLHPSNKIWLRANDQILEMYGSALGQVRLNQSLMGDTFEINNYVFHFYGGTYTNASGSLDYFIPKTRAIITPDPGPWLAQGAGKQLVPTTLEPQQSLDSALGSWTDVYGDFSYLMVEHNPPAIKLFAGTNWLFGMKNPASVFAPTVDF